MKQDTLSKEARAAHAVFEGFYWGKQQKKFDDMEPGLYVVTDKGLVSVPSVWSGLSLLSKDK